MDSRGFLWIQGFHSEDNIVSFFSIQKATCLFSCSFRDINWYQNIDLSCFDGGRHNDDHLINDEVVIYSKQSPPYLVRTLIMTAMVNGTIRMHLNLICVVIIIEIGLQPMMKMTVKMMSMKKTFMEDIMVLLGNMLVIIQSTI